MALSAVLPAQDYVFRAYRQTEGLKNLAVNAVATDRSGFLWVATENGVYRFEGSNFEQFGPQQGIAELDAVDLVADPNGTIWVGTQGNLYRWDGQRFQPAGRNPIPITDARHIAVEDATHLLIVDKHHLYRLEHDSQGRMLSYLPAISSALLASIPMLGQISAVNVVRAPLKSRSIWIGCGKKLYSWRDEESGGRTEPSARQITEWDANSGLPEDQWENVLRDRSGAIWVTGRSRVMALPSGASRFVDRRIPVPDNAYGHAPLIEDPEGRILAPTGDQIARWEGTYWRFIGRANGMERVSRISSMVFDASGDLWLGTRGNGIVHWIGYRDWEGWTDSQGLPSAMIWSALPLGRDRVIVGTEKGLAWVNPVTGQAGKLSSTLPWTYGQVGSLGLDRDGSIWAATFSGSILRIDPKSGRTQQTAKLPEFIDNALTDSAGRVLFATKTGIYLREPGASAGAPKRIAAVDALLGAPSWIYGSCAAPNGAAWFLGGNRLLREKDGPWSEPPIDGQPKLRGTLLALSCAPDGDIWVSGDQTGTWRLTPLGNRLRARQLPLPSELSSLAPLAILVDRRGWVWLGTDGGLLVWNGNIWRHLTEESGLIWDDVDQGVLKESADGSIWVGTSTGLAHLIHPERVFDSVPLDVSVTGIRHNGNSFDPAAQMITLPWSRLPLQFHIASSSMRNRSELIFKYRMGGLHSGWIESHEGEAVFSGLPPGNYTFLAMAANPGLNALSDVLRIQIKILPPWWRANWFIGLMILAALLLLLAGDRLRARNQRERSKQLENLVKERTRELEERTHELETSREELRVQALHDGLTGMLNRAGFLRAMAAEMDRARRANAPLVVALIDLDHFKLVNDQFGHLAGDEALRWFAATIGTHIRGYDCAGRYGGEEFLLLLADIPLAVTEQRLASLHAAVSNLEVRWQESKFILNCSIGATIFDPSKGHRSIESLLAVADHALYAAKEAGRNCVVFMDAACLDAGHGRPRPQATTPI
jgi:diguanylate cyclase (GGDEF)-like protein